MTTLFLVNFNEGVVFSVFYQISILIYLYSCYSYQILRLDNWNAANLEKQLSHLRVRPPRTNGTQHHSGNYRFLCLFSKTPKARRHLEAGRKTDGKLWLLSACVLQVLVRWADPVLSTICIMSQCAPGEEQVTPHPGAWLSPVPVLCKRQSASFWHGLLYAKLCNLSLLIWANAGMS